MRWCGRADPPLTELGRQEAAALADRLSGRLDTAPTIVASSARRTIETAHAVADRFGVPIAIDPDLREVDVGRVEGLTFDEVATVFPNVAAALTAGRRDIDWPGGETVVDLGTRARRAWDGLLVVAAPGAELVVVSHGGLIRELLWLAVAAAPEVWFGPTSALRLVADGCGGWQLAERLDPPAPALDRAAPVTR